MNFFPKPLVKDKRSKSENFRRLNETFLKWPRDGLETR